MKSTMFGEDGEQALRTKFELACFLKEQRHLEEALSISESVLTARQDILCPGNLETLQSSHLVVSLVRHVEENLRGRSVVLSDLGEACRVLGDDHEATTDSKPTSQFVCGI